MWRAGIRGEGMAAFKQEAGIAPMSIALKVLIYPHK